MADYKESYPSIPVTHWWKLREKFQQTIPTSVSPSYLAVSLGMKENSARANIMPALIAFGIIDENGKPKDRAVSWRDDEQYASVCEEIRNEIYPKELLEAVPAPVKDREAARRWFANRTGSGKTAVDKMTSAYVLLCEGIPLKLQDVSQIVKKPTIEKKSSVSKKKTQTAAETSLLENKNMVASTISPTIHIDIQIHISPDASAEQIDQIFEKMSKHLFRIEHE